jgi:hypothetical protein
LWGNEGVIVKEPGGFRDVDSDGAGGIVINYDPSLLKRLNANGQQVWGPVFVPSGISEVLVDTIDQWIYVRNGGGKLRVNKLFLSDGGFLWDSLGVIIDTLGVQERVKGFDFIPNNGVAITWNEEISSGNWDVFVQWLRPDGNFLYDIGGIPVSIYFSSKNAWGLRASTKIDTSVIVYWGDSRGGAIRTEIE